MQMGHDEKTIKQLADTAGITVRTLQYYDEIDLLSPSNIAMNGYRQYDEDSIRKLQQIMFFRELDIPLKQIKQIVADESYDERKVLKKHKELLILKRERLDGLIGLVDRTLGGYKVSLKEFDMSEIEKCKQIYAKEAEQKWGSTEEYKQSTVKTSKYSKSDWRRTQDERSQILEDFAACMRSESRSKQRDEMVKQWQQHITKNYYNCTDELLLGLADIYVQDERFIANLDENAEGLAEFISSSIKNYIGKRE